MIIMKSNNEDIGMTNSPLTSGEQAKVFIFALLMIPTLLVFAGILPAIFLAFGVFLLKKNKDFSAIETSVKLVVGYLWIGLILAGGTACYFGSTYGTEAATWYDGDWKYDIEFFAFIGISVTIIVYMILIKSLYLSPLQSHRDWVTLNGIFSSTSAEAKQSVKVNEIKIIKGENLRSYSVADELSKWARLRDEGVVSEAEFQEARNKILQSQ
jgi:hypothetical protein